MDSSTEAETENTGFAARHGKIIPKPANKGAFSFTMHTPETYFRLFRRLRQDGIRIKACIVTSARDSDADAMH